MPNPRLVGTVGFFPEHYGDKVLGLAVDLLQHKSVPPALYTAAQLITPANVDQFYPKEIFSLSEQNEI